MGRPTAGHSTCRWSHVCAAVAALFFGPRACSAQFLQGLDPGKLAGALRDVHADQVVGSAVEALKDPHTKELAATFERPDTRRALEAVVRESPRVAEVLKNTDTEKMQQVLEKADPAKISKALEALDALDRWGQMWPAALATLVASIAALMLARCQLKRQLKRWRQRGQPALLGGDEEAGPALELAGEKPQAADEGDESAHFQAF